MADISFMWLIFIGIAGAFLGRIISRFIALRKQKVNQTMVTDSEKRRI